MRKPLQAGGIPKTWFIWSALTQGLHLQLRISIIIHNACQW